MPLEAKPITMHLLITGGCGFVGSRIAKWFLANEPLSSGPLSSGPLSSEPVPGSYPDRRAPASSGDGSSGSLTPGLKIPGLKITLVDNLMRPGSQTNRAPLECLGAEVILGDLRQRDFVESLPACDWVIDCAANPSVLAGLGSAALDAPANIPSQANQSPSQNLVDHNLGGTIHLLEYCKRHRAGMVLVSSSRVYSIRELSGIPHQIKNSVLQFDWDRIESENLIPGLSRQGIDERFSIEPPLSLYGATKLASEWLAKEYSNAFDFPLWINRCGILAGSGQFGKADQGIITYWMHRFLYRHPLRMLGFQGSGAQVRDCLHPDDLARLVQLQIGESIGESQGRQTQQPLQNQPSLRSKPIAVNVSGGIESAFSLQELHEWCARRWGSERFGAVSELQRIDQPRPYDAPWIVLDSNKARQTWNWEPLRDRLSIWEEIAEHAEENPNWLQISGGID
ncbi:MAG: NAD-dependent epimerase/dehydratase family protein [Planctomycetota bacterium]|nr:MAG: NAD-dependent epimerase/dehydratase family protein [Planctomycetota bacterium]